MVYEFGFGKEIQKVDISDNISVRELTANKDIEFKAIDADIVNALENPIGSKRLKDIVKPGEKIAIITSDITRPMPTYKVMPALIEELEAGGVKAVQQGSYRQSKHCLSLGLLNEMNTLQSVGVLISSFLQFAAI